MSDNTLVKAGDVVNVHYKGTLEDGEQFDSSYDRGEPIKTIVGSGGLIKGFDQALVGMEVGAVKSVTIPANEAYGERNDAAVAELAKTVFPTEFVDQITALEVKEESIVFDLNHPMAGKDLTFDIEIVNIDDNTEE